MLSVQRSGPREKCWESVWFWRWDLKMPPCKIQIRNGTVIQKNSASIHPHRYESLPNTMHPAVIVSQLYWPRSVYLEIQSSPATIYSSDRQNMNCWKLPSIGIIFILKETSQTAVFCCKVYCTSFFCRPYSWFLKYKDVVASLNAGGHFQILGIDNILSSYPIQPVLCWLHLTSEKNVSSNIFLRDCFVWLDGEIHVFDILKTQEELFCQNCVSRFIVDSANYDLLFL